MGYSFHKSERSLHIRGLDILNAGQEVNLPGIRMKGWIVGLSTDIFRIFTDAPDNASLE
jgi:hypothetical protein